MAGQSRTTLTDAEAQRANLAAFKTWVARNRARIMAKPGTSVVYSGGAYDIDMAVFDKSDQTVVTNTKMWDILKRNRAARLKGKQNGRAHV